MKPIQSILFLDLLLIMVFTGCQSNSVKDIDGNRYKTVKIGTQTWLSGNLKTTRYNDGTGIPEVKKYGDWETLSTPAYCWYNNDSAHKEDYGALYNWFAVNTDKICPKGWHVPTDKEWKELRATLGDNGNAGSALKESGTAHWRGPNTGATNASGFSALPGGYRDLNGPFNLLRADGYWWSSTESTWWSSPGKTPSISFYRNLRYDDRDIYRNAGDKKFGFCVRCVLDQEK